jgi:hypothetical protein
MDTARSPRKWLGIGLALGICTLSSVALAGWTSSNAVVVSSSGGYAYGSVNGARYSADDNQQIGCESDSGGFVYCYATDSTGASVSCYSYSLGANGVTTAGSVNPMSNIMFYFTPSTGECTTIYVENGSNYLH